MDEAHLIPGKPTLEEIRLLTNFQLDDRNLIAIVLVGQPELRERLRHRTYRALTQRIGASFHLVPLERRRHRRLREPPPARVAAAERPLFTEAAVLRLHEAASGIPRLVNHLATQALLEGMARGLREIDESVVAAVAGDHDLQTGSGSPATHREAAPASGARR